MLKKMNERIAVTNTKPKTISTLKSHSIFLSIVLATSPESTAAQNRHAANSHTARMYESCLHVGRVRISSWVLLGMCETDGVEQKMLKDLKSRDFEYHALGIPGLLARPHQSGTTPSECNSIDLKSIES